MALYDKWLDGAIARLGYIKAERWQPVEAAFAGESPLWPGTAGGNLTDEQRERLAVASAWVYSDVREIANLGSAARINVMRSQGEQETAEVNHAFEILMRRPTPRMRVGYGWLMQYTLWWLLLRGEAYWWKVADLSGELAEILPVPASRMAPIPDPVNYIRGYAYTPLDGRQPVILPPEQVVFFRFPNPFDFHRGLSPLSAYRLALETDRAASEWNRNTFRDDVTLRTLISLPETLSDPIFRQRRQEIIEELLEHHRRFMIARAGDVKAERLGLSQSDAEYLGGREFTRKEMDRAYGFPEGYWSEKANRANAEAAKSSLIEGTIWPVLSMLADDITSQVVIPMYGADLRAEFDDIRPRDRDMAVREASVFWRVKTVDEAREELGLRPLDDPEIGSTLVSMVGRPAVPTFGPAPQGAPPQIPPPAQPAEEPPPGEEAKADLKRWESIARRRARAGEPPGEYVFQSSAIPADMLATIHAALAQAQSEEEVKAAFAAAPFRLTWDGYP